jgi:predicted amidohydrolase
VKITSLQLAVNDGAKEENVTRALLLLDKAPDSDLILLPEIWPSGFFAFDRYRAASEPLDGPTVAAFQIRARQRGCHILMGSFVERDDNGLYNTTVLLGPQGDVLARYRKIHLFGFESEEKSLLNPGKDVVVVDVPWGKTGLSTCYDLRFPEFYRRMLELGARFFLVASAWPDARLEAWRLFNRARAHENLAYLVSCNCAGVNRGKQYAGHSMIVDPLGRIVAEAGESECVVHTEIDPGLAESVRQEFSFLNDRVFR